MAEFRTVQTRIWRGDEWFQTLPTDGRLLWLYLFTNESANASGSYRITLRTIARSRGWRSSAWRRSCWRSSGGAQGILCRRLAIRGQDAGVTARAEVAWQLATRIAQEVAGMPDGELKDRYLARYRFPLVTWTVDAQGKKHARIDYQDCAPSPLPPEPAVLLRAGAPVRPGAAPADTPRQAAHRHTSAGAGADLSGSGRGVPQGQDRRRQQDGTLHRLYQRARGSR